jgi:hypothetical protein
VIQGCNNGVDLPVIIISIIDERKLVFCKRNASLASGDISKNAEAKQFMSKLGAS